MRLYLILILLFFTCMSDAQVPGSIIDPAFPATNIMNPDGNGFITSTGAAFSGPLDESEFELPFLPVLQYDSEPGNDNQIFPPCSLYDFVNDLTRNAGSSYYYYTDPDGVSDNGDEFIVFRFRLARFSQGVAGFSVLMDTDYRFGFSGPEADPNAVSGNPGFEREIAAFSSTGSDGGVRVFNVDGKDTASVINYAASIHSNYQVAYALNQDPACSSRLPVFVDMFVPFSSLGISSVTQVRMAFAVNEEPKTSLKGGASDIGGVNGYLIPDDDDQFIAAITNYYPIAIGDPANQAPLGIDETVFLDENTINGSYVHTVSASDPNGDVLSYSITGGNTGSAFAINSASGEITVNDTGALDVETTASFTLVVKISDGKLYDNAVVTIQLNDLNEGPPVLSDAIAFVDENMPNGLVVYTASGTDPDATAELSYSIVEGNPDAVFAIDARSGDISVNNSGALDFETVTSFMMTIRVSDGSFFDDAFLTINVKDANEPPVVVSSSITVEERMSRNDIVTKIIAMDPDANDVLSYEIKGGNADGMFAVDDRTGDILLQMEREFNLAPGTYNLEVSATDRYGLTGKGLVRIIMGRKPDRGDIHPQKAFSPDGNGNNDFWLITGIEAFSDNVIQIFNRWGVPVFEVHGYDNDRHVWRGEGKGTSTERESTYFFIIRAAHFQPITGYVIVKP